MCCLESVIVYSLRSFSGGFYQDEIGQTSGCKLCNRGTFVPLRKAPGKSAGDCDVCPTGTDKARHASYRACACLPGYYRMDRFGNCTQCPGEGIDCSGEYQSLNEGYWWTWNIDGNEAVSHRDMFKYIEFVNNIKVYDDNYNRNTTFYHGKIPIPHECPGGKKACPVNGDGISPSCGDGYEGWLCSNCSTGYYPWFENCLKCPTSWWVYVIEVVCVFCLLVAVVAIAVRDYRNKDKSSRRSLLDILVGRFKIVLAYYQIAGAILTSIHDIQWPKTISEFGDIFKYLELNIYKILVKPRCVIPELQMNIYTQFIFGISLCVLGVCLPYMIYVCRKLYNMYHFRHDGIPNSIHKRMTQFRDKCFFAVIVVLFITFPSVCEVILGFMPPACDSFCLYRNGTGTCLHSVSKLRSDYGIDCSNPKYLHYQIASYVSLIYVVGFPACTLFLIKRHFTTSNEKIHVNEEGCLHRSENNDHSEDSSASMTEDNGGNEEDNARRELTQIGDESREDSEDDGDEDNNNRLDNDNTMLIDGERPSADPDPMFVRFLCENYKPTYWYWEIVELTRKLLQTSIVILWGSGHPFTLALSISVSVVYTVVHAYVKPMKDTFEHWLQMVSLMAIFFNLLAALYFKIATTNETFTTAFIIIVNTSVVLLAIGKFH